MRSICFTVFTLVFSTASFAQQAATPTEYHEILKKEVGTWTAVMTMQVPGAEKPIVLPAKETNRLMKGGLWMLSEYESGPFRGQAQLGYDPTKKKYVGTWIDSSSAHLSVMEGDYDESKNELTMLFGGIDHATGSAVELKSVSRFSSDDKRSYVMYTKRGDDWVQTFEIQYERAE